VVPSSLSLPNVSFLLTLTLLAHSAFCGLAATGTAGVQGRQDFKGMGFGYDVSVYDEFDGQVLLGVQSGQGTSGDPSAVPVLAAAYVRLPLGTVVVPVLTGGIGYAFSNSAAGILWRGGGAFDIRNGRHSSLLLGAEYEGHENYGGGLALRGGLLLEY